MTAVLGHHEGAPLPDVGQVLGRDDEVVVARHLAGVGEGERGQLAAALPASLVLVDADPLGGERLRLELEVAAGGVDREPVVGRAQRRQQGGREGTCERLDAVALVVRRSFGDEGLEVDVLDRQRPDPTDLGVGQDKPVLLRETTVGVVAPTLERVGRLEHEVGAVVGPADRDQLGEDRRTDTTATALRLHPWHQPGQVLVVEGGRERDASSHDLIAVDGDHTVLALRRVLLRELDAHLVQPPDGGVGTFEPLGSLTDLVEAGKLGLVERVEAADLHPSKVGP